MSNQNNQYNQNQKNQGKVKTSTTIHTDTKTIMDHGTTETTVTKTITEHYSDGTTSIRKEIQTTKEEEISSDGQVVNNSKRRFSTGSEIMPSSSSPGTNTDSRSRKPSLDVENMPPMTRMTGYIVDPSSPRADLKTDESFLEEALFCHNTHRAKHGSPQLSLSTELCKVAQSWANHLAQIGTMENSHYGYGENIYWSSGPGKSLRGDVPVDYWYSEKNKFDWNRMDFQKTTGSFTQIVWKDSKQLGIAKSFNSKGTYIVAFYVPPGNVLGHFEENVKNVPNQNC